MSDRLVLVAVAALIVVAGVAGLLLGQAAA